MIRHCRPQQSIPVTILVWVFEDAKRVLLGLPESPAAYLFAPAVPL